MQHATPAQFDIILPAIRLGFARAASEAGLTPAEAELKIAGMAKSAGLPLPSIETLLDKYWWALLGAGAIGGGLSGVARHKLEQRADNREDPEINADMQKAEGYDRMSDDLKRQQAATVPEFTPPRVQEAMR